MKNIIIIITFTLLLLSCLQLIAQRTCGTLDLSEIEQKYPEHAAELQRIEAHIKEFSENSGEKKISQIVTIPTVFHIIHTGTVGTGNNIPDDYIYAQLSQMNDDFRRLNSDADNVWSQADDTEIEFCLATVDTNGDPTTGITRHMHDTGNWQENDIETTIKPATIWNRDDYLNVWVIPSPRDNGDDELLGYAQFPGGSANTDGVVVKTSSVGSIDLPNPSGGNFNIGRTATHEVGHWLNLRHIWGDGGCLRDDKVSDTPKSNAANFGCDIGHTSCSSTDMVQNYMDYSDDACMNLFTTGQKDRMLALFASGGDRESLLNSNRCVCPADITHTGVINSDTYETSNSITSTAIIGDNQNVTYDAGGFICLNPAFTADASNGVVFLAQIDGCTVADSFPGGKVDQVSDESVTFKNYPNPFTGHTTIEFTLSKDTPVTLLVSDATGRQVEVLLDNEVKTEGTHLTNFDGSNYPAGMYYYTIQAGEYVGTQKMVLVK